MTTLDEMWQRLAQHQPYADKYGYGPSWMIMCKVRSYKAAVSADNQVLHEGASWDAAYAAYSASGAVSSLTTYLVTVHAASAVNYINKAEQLYDNR